MAEAFALAASVLSVASLAIQLGDSLQKAYEFWESIEDGPDDVCRISTELRLLANIFHSIERENKLGAIDSVQEQLVHGALQIAKKDIDELTAVISELSRAMGPDQSRMRRKWARVKIVLKSGTIAKMRGHIESSKSILNLLQASRTQSAIFQMKGTIDLLTATFSTTHVNRHKSTGELLPSLPSAYQGFESDTMALVRASREYNDMCSWELEEPHDSAFAGQIRTKNFVKTIDAGLGALTVRSTSTKITRSYDVTDMDNGKLYTKKSFVINFLWRFATCRRGFRFSINNSFDSWTFNIIQRRPAESQIFNLCKIGKTSEVSNLLRHGLASVFDADPQGATLLHYACKYGHSNLARLLIDRGADIYARTDDGNDPIEFLEEYDRYQDVRNRRDVAKIVDSMIRYADFDPFDWEDPGNHFDTLTLWNGLPYENLKHLFTQNALYATPEQRFEFILGNLLQLRESVDSGQECIDLLLMEYEKLRSSPTGQSKWDFYFTLLQHLVFHWLDRMEGSGRGPAFKISRALKLTNDLWRRDREGTALDTVARYDGSMVSQWLGLLSANGVNLPQYVRYEQAQHPDGLINQGPDVCCRVIEVAFNLGELEDDLGIEISNFCDPRFEHLDPDFRCEVSRRRELCISKIDDAFIGGDGKPLASIPGSWTTTLKPNSDLLVTLKFYEHGWQYTDLLEAPCSLWKDGSDAMSQESSDLDSSADDAETLDSDDKADEVVGRKNDQSPNSKMGNIETESSQKSPHSGREAPVRNDSEQFENRSYGGPASKSPCSGKEAPNPRYPHSKTKLPANKAPCSWEKAPF